MLPLLYGVRVMVLDELPHRMRDPATWLMILGLAIASVLIGAGWLAGKSARDDSWDAAGQSSQNLMLALRRDIGRSVASLDLSLRGAQDALTMPELRDSSPGLRRQALFDRSIMSEDFGPILIVRPDGDIAETSGTTGSAIPSVAGEDFFRVHVSRSDGGLHVSGVARDGICGPGSCLVLSRRVTSREGRFEGVVLGTLGLAYFQWSFAKMALGAHGTITIIGSDDRIMWRFPDRDGQADHDAGRFAPFDLLTAEQPRQKVDVSGNDSVRRMHTFAKVDGAPLVLSVNVAVDDVLAHWRRRAAVIAPTLLFLSAAIIGVTLLLWPRDAPALRRRGGVGPRRRRDRPLGGNRRADRLVQSPSVRA